MVISLGAYSKSIPFLFFIMSFLILIILNYLYSFRQLVSRVSSVDFVNII